MSSNIVVGPSHVCMKSLVNRSPSGFASRFVRVRTPAPLNGSTKVRVRFTGMMPAALASNGGRTVIGVMSMVFKKAYFRICVASPTSAVTSLLPPSTVVEVAANDGVVPVNVAEPTNPLKVFPASRLLTCQVRLSFGRVSLENQSGRYGTSSPATCHR